MSVSVLVEAVEAEGFGGGGVVATAFGDVQVAGVFDGRGDGGADGGQVGGPAAGPAGGGVFTERCVPYMVMRLDGPVLADQAGQVRRGGVRAGQAGDEVPRAFRTVHPLGWTIWKGEVFAPTEEELLTGIQGRSREDGDRDLAPDRPSGEGARYQRRHPRKLGWHIPP